MVIHEDPKHECTKCGKRMALSSQLRIHMLRHTKEKNWLCSYCGKGFTLMCLLKSHLLHKHRKDIANDAKDDSNGQLDDTRTTENTEGSILTNAKEAQDLNDKEAFASPEITKSQIGFPESVKENVPVASPSDLDVSL